MNLRKIIFVLCAKLILTSYLILYSDLQKSEISNEPTDSDKSNILQDSIDTQNSVLLGWWGPYLPEDPSNIEFFEYDCFGKGGVFHFLELGYRKYMGKDVLT